MMARILIILALLGGVAEARPGGGHSSSGGGRSSSSSSSSSSSGRSHSGGSSYHSSSYGGGGAIGGEALIGLIILFGFIWFIAAMVNKGSGNAWTSNSLADVPPPPPAPNLDLAPVLARDPTFSLALFEDFVFELYAAAQRRRDQLATLQPYLSPEAANQLALRGPPPAQVLVGVLRVQRAIVRPSDVHLLVYIEATLIGAGAPIASTERWSFVRSAAAQTKPPERTRTWPCPSCGAPWQPSPTRTCANCGQAVRTGQFDWGVETVWVDAEEVANASLTGTVEEYGNDLPTVVDPQAAPRLAAITADDPAVTFETLYPRVQLIYNQLNTAWNANDLTPVRGLVTASLRAYLAYWLSAYARQGLRNALTGAELETAELAKVTRDAFYDAITVRIVAHGFDATFDGKDRVVGGSTTRVRPYSEYWTFIRASARRGKVTTTPSCPNCGAPLQISDIGDCEHCGVAVENGSFDWTLSKIEQDDNYAG